MTDTIILIPARMSASRLPGKPLADIHGKPMIVHVLEKALRSGAGDVYVAVGDQEIGDAVAAAGGKYILTDPALPSGTDRIAAALRTIDPIQKYKKIINLQGDLPNIQSEFIAETAKLLNDPTVGISTLATPLTDIERINNPNVVKVIFNDNGKAIYFSRSKIPYETNQYYSHIGIYGYQRSTLERFISLPPSPLEQAERLEQLRALEDNIYIKVGLVDEEPIAIDTADDLIFLKKKYTICENSLAQTV